MAISLKFYNNSGLSSEATLLTVLQGADGASAAVDSILYLGSLAAGKKFQAESAPGIDSIVVSILDSAIGSGVAASAVKLATSAGGLAGAVAGASLALGTQILSGTVNAIAIHVRIDTPPLPVGNYTELSLAINSLIESAV